MKKYIMSLDQGTTSSRCILFNHDGQVVSTAGKEFSQIYPNPGWVEHDPREIWSSQLGVIGEAIGRIGASALDIEAIGITNQRETTILWDRNTGQPVYNAIVWQCRRTSHMIDELKGEGYEEYIRKKTGLIPDAYFSATKIKWILDNVEGVRKRAEKGEILFGTVDTWLIWNLTKGEVFATDYTNASRTMLFNIHDLCWDKGLLYKLGVPEAILPEVFPSGGLFGYAHESILGARIPISGVAGDQQSALFGDCCFESGSAKNTYGTGCFLLMNTGSEAIYSKNGLITTIAASAGTQIHYALEGSVFNAGAVIQWLRDEMGLIHEAGDSEKYAARVEDTNGVYIVPAFTGLGAPYWNQYARGAVFGLTRGVTKEHFIRAALESLAYQTYDVLEAMKLDSGINLKDLRVDGGASANNLLMQFQSDILGVEVVRPKVIETTALGAAYLAGLAVGYWNDAEDIKKSWVVENRFRPLLNKDEVERRLSGWKKAVQCTLAY